METFEGLRRKLARAEDLRSVVHSLKLLASVGMRQHERAVAALAEYGRALELGFQLALRHRPEGFFEDAPRRGVRARPAAIVLGSDQGMCGGFNERVARKAAERLHALAHGAPVPVLAVGRRTLEHLRDPMLRVEGVLAAPSSPAGVLEAVQEILPRIEAWRAAGRFDVLLVLHNRRGRGTACSPEVRHALPVPARWLRGLERRPWPGRTLPAFTMEWDRLYAALVREHVVLTLCRALMESLESESASRLAAMDRAERNVDERIEALQAELRKARQSAITSELMDVISGFQAVAGED